jgi:hypothetical protein
MRRLLGHREHFFRMAGLFGVGILLFILARALFVPKGFGELGHYRTGALANNRARPPSFAGRAACVECHDAVPPAQKGGKHASIRCEACHWALAAHAENPADNKPAKLDPKVLCVKCHLANVAKPKGFPQIDPKDHMDGNSCTECHDPHYPSKEPQKK